MILYVNLFQLRVSMYVMGFYCLSQAFPLTGFFIP